MNNYRLTIDLQMDGNETAKAFAQVLRKTMQLTEEITIDICDHKEAHVILCEMTLQGVDTFTSN